MSSSDEDNKVLEALCSHVVPFPCPIPPEEEEQVLDQMVPGRAEIVLLGEATHGTEEFYQLRRLLTKHLILERGFRAILLEVRGLCLWIYFAVANLRFEHNFCKCVIFARSSLVSSPSSHTFPSPFHPHPHPSFEYLGGMARYLLRELAFDASQEPLPKRRCSSGSDPRPWQAHVAKS